MLLNEKQIENSILNFLTIHKVFCWKNQTTGIYDPKIKAFRASFNPHHLKGVADILGVFKGKFLAIEVKSKDGKLSDNQKIFLQRVTDSGSIAIVARSIDDVAEKLDIKI